MKKNNGANWEEGNKQLKKKNKKGEKKYLYYYLRGFSCLDRIFLFGPDFFVFQNTPTTYV